MGKKRIGERFVKEGIIILIVVIIESILYMIIEMVTSNTTYAIIAAILVAFPLVLVWLYWYMKKREKNYKEKMELLGLEKVYKKFGDAPSSLKIIESARRSVEFLGISARTFFESEDTEEMVQKKIKEGVSFKFLILDPDSPFTEVKAKDEGDEPEAWKHDIGASISRINRLGKGANSQKIEVRTYDAFPIWRAIFVDNKIGYVLYYPHGHRGEHSPLILFKDKEISLYDPLHDYFIQLWNISGDSK